jgi:spore maturation protein SpmA/spore maturation protein SpmB
MLNYIWLGLVLAAVVIGGLTGNMKAVADRALEMAKFAVLDTALPLVGIMALWLGIMRLAERAGLVALLARGLRPLLIRLFPDVPANHPAMGSMVMNMAANMLGLGNAATPLGLRAMRDLETLNPHPGTATNAMCTFLAVNTASIQLIPVTAIAILAANKSANPTAIVGTTLMASSVGAVTAVSMAKLLQNLPAFRVKAAEAASVPPRQAAAQPDTPAVKEAEGLAPLRWWGKLIMSLFGAFFLFLLVRMMFPTLFGDTGAGDGQSPSLFIRFVDSLSRLSIPLLLCLFPLYAALRKVKVYEEFVDGAREGFDVGIRIIPYLVAILVAIGMFRAAGGIDMLGKALSGVMAVVGFPPDLLPLAIMRPLSGSGTLGIFTELVKTFGPDSLIVRMGGTIFGSTETTFYVLAVYFGSVGIKRTRHAVAAGLTGDFMAAIAAVIFCRLVFG